MSDLDKNLPTDAIYLNFSEAFDTVSPIRLIYKLKGYGISGNLLNWIHDFLSDRSQYVQINESKSTLLPVTSGVPQGSVLGPTLFIYYINDLPNCTTANIKIFADDTKVFTTINDTNDQLKLQSAIDSLYEWTNKWLLKFNDTKCKVMHIGLNNPHYTYTIGNSTSKISLESTNIEKDIGVYIDPLLKFNHHVTEIVKKANRVKYQIIKNIAYKTKNIRIPLFKGLVRPILEYANIIWNNNLRKQSDEIERVQRTFTKLISEVRNLEYEDRLMYLNLPSLEFRRFRGDLIEMFKITHDIYDPKTTENLFTFSNNQRLRQHEFKVNKFHTCKQQYKTFFTNRIVNVWNKLPPNIVQSDSINIFKNQIDKHFREYMFSTNLLHLY